MSHTVITIRKDGHSRSTISNKNSAFTSFRRQVLKIGVGHDDVVAVFMFENGELRYWHSAPQK